MVVLLEYLTMSETNSQNPVHYCAWLIIEAGFRDVRLLSSSTRWIAIQPKMFTHAIVIGRVGDYCGYDDFWCYKDYNSAKQALNAWDGIGEPIGWIRHTPSGRRVSQSLDEFDENGHKVAALGVMYRRH